MKGTTKKRYTLVSGDGQDLFEFQILAIFALKFALKQASNAWYTLKTAKLSKSKVLKHPPPFPIALLDKTLDLDLKSDKTDKYVSLKQHAAFL